MSSNKVYVSAWEEQMTPKRCCVSDRRVQSLVHSKLHRPRQTDKQGSKEDITGVSISRQPLSSSARVRRGDACPSRVVLRN